MPYPIKPVHTLDLHAEIFDSPFSPSDAAGLSALQMQFLGGENTREAAKFSAQTLQYLSDIEKSKDELLTTASSLASKCEKDPICRVPGHISDHQLLAMKTEGLVLGQGRTVSLTEKGQIALRDAYLTSSNQFKSQRTKDKFDYRAAEESAEVKTASSKFKRVSG